jgi:hypothetical protein
MVNSVSEESFSSVFTAEVILPCSNRINEYTYLRGSSVPEREQYLAIYISSALKMHKVNSRETSVKETVWSGGNVFRLVFERYTV